MKNNYGSKKAFSAIESISGERKKNEECDV